jgi:hypothetical protein
MVVFRSTLQPPLSFYEIGISAMWPLSHVDVSAEQIPLSFLQADGAALRRPLKRKTHFFPSEPEMKRRVESGHH